MKPNKAFTFETTLISTVIMTPFLCDVDFINNEQRMQNVGGPWHRTRLTTSPEPLVQIKIMSQNVPNDALYHNCKNGFTPPNKGSTRAVDKKYLSMISPSEPLVQIIMFPIMSSTTTAQMVSFHRAAVDKKYLQMISPPEPLVEIQNNVT